MRRNTLESFVRKAREVHGDTYDYSKVEYTDNKTHVTISCPKHGDFKQRPDRHLTGTGCPLCGIDKKKRLIRGVAENDTCISRSESSFKSWNGILKRCFPISEHEKKIFRSYSGCKICDDWLKFSNFLKWYQENAVDGYVIDKDLFSSPDEKKYSPDTCCFIPKEINNALQYKHLRMRKFHNRFYNKSKKTYEAKLNIKGKTVTIGRFNTEEEAINAYIKSKTYYIEQLANEYYSKGLISERVYKQLINFKVNYANYQEK